MSVDALPPVPPSRSRDRELWVGLFVILGVTAALTALFLLTDATLFRGRYVVETVVQDAGGIRRGDPVQMRGVNIGRVKGFRILPEGVRVDLEIEGEYPIPSGSRVELRSSGLLGGMVANVVPAPSPQSASWGDELPGSTEAGVFDQMEELQAHATRALERVQRLLDEETIRNVHEGGDDLRRLVDQLEEIAAGQRGQIEALAGSLRRSAEALEKTVGGPEVGRSVARLEALIERLDGLAATVNRTSRSADSLLSRVDRGEGTLGRLARDEALYDSLTTAAASVRRAADEFAGLAADIRAQPKKYVQVSLF